MFCLPCRTNERLVLGDQSSFTCPPLAMIGKKFEKLNWLANISLIYKIFSSNQYDTPACPSLTGSKTKKMKLLVRSSQSLDLNLIETLWPAPKQAGHECFLPHEQLWFTVYWLPAPRVSQSAIGLRV